MSESKDKKAEATKVAKAMLEMMQSLTGVMDYEVDLLARQDYAGLNGLRLEKARLVRDYQLSITRLSENPTLLKNAEPDMRQQLRAVGEGLDKSSKRNAHELESAIIATQALVQTVMDFARGQLTQNDGYKNTCDVSHMAGVYSPTSQAVAIDQNA